ncbi:MAG TPA: hypothetical protein VEX68_00430 [Bryobacteraceae bacterium]|nr:hypothetical protein [Bryobacteraceae bacterium]
MPSESLVRIHLERITTSAEFAGAPRLTQFLQFVVEMSLSGAGDQIKESLVAVEVYGRRPDYNPQVDSTVRVEAGRLRARLRRYYDSTGAVDQVRIELPKGGYAPVFTELAEPEPSPKAPLNKRLRRSHILAATSLVLFCIAMGTYALTHTKPGSPLVGSVAVLPFVNLSDSPSTERFVNGLTEDLTTTLARNTSLRVPARTGMAQYKNKTVDLNRLGKEHGVRAVLEGSVRSNGSRIVITTQLIDTTNGYHLWADRFEHNAEHLADVQNAVSARIVSGLSKRLAGDVTADEVDSKTMEMYHRASDLLRIPVLKDGVPDKLPPTISEAVRLYEQVTVRRPHFARGWAGLAEAAEWEYEMRGNQPRERLLQAKAAAQRAIQLEPDLVEAWTVLTSVLFFREWDINGAEAACRRTIELDPRNTAARQRYVDVLRVQGRMAEARFEVDRAIELQPAAAAFRIRRAVMLYQSGQHEQAFTEAQAAAALTNQMPAYPMSLWVQGLSLQGRGQQAAAEKIFRSALAFQPHDPWNEPSLGHLFASTGRKAEAEAILHELRSQLGRGRLTYTSMAIIYTALGRYDEALTSLERGWQAREDSLLFAPLDPRLQPLRSEQRFRSLIQKDAFQRLKRASTL